MLKNIPHGMVAGYYQKNGMLDRKWKEEAHLLSNALECCAMLGALAVRMAFTTKNGQSDLLICYRGKFYAAELKAVDGVSSQLQRKFIEEVEEAGGKGAVIYTLHDLLDLLMQ